MIMMRHFMMVSAFWACAALAPAQEPPDGEPPGGEPPRPSSCLGCHLELDGLALEAAQKSKEDVHFEHGLSCHDCHGGDPDAGHDGDLLEAHNEDKGFLGKPERLKIPQFCARCHADAVFMKQFNPQARVDQLSEYRTSNHGKRNADGDTNVAVCIDCHGVHGIRPPTDPRSWVHPTRVADTCARCHNQVDLMDSYGITASQHVGYKSSVHAEALYDKGDTSAPTCNDCHGSHGAAPPGVQSVTAVCGSCHTREATLFRETELKKGVDLDPCIKCTVCHDNHAVVAPTPEMMGVGPKSTCTSCHPPEVVAYEKIAAMSDAYEVLRKRHAEAHELLDAAESAGLEVSADQFALQGAQNEIIEARVLVHSFDQERFMEAVNKAQAIADAGVRAGEAAFEDLHGRRTGLALGLVFIAAVIAGLFLKIKEVEAAQKS